MEDQNQVAVPPSHPFWKKFAEGLLALGIDAGVLIASGGKVQLLDKDGQHNVTINSNPIENGQIFDKGEVKTV